VFFLLCTDLRRKFFTIQTPLPLPKKEDMMKTSSSRLARRSFLLAVGAGGVATAAAIAGGKRHGQPKKAVAATRGKGYQLTEHVRKYYDTTKV
jgi:hypothetical protein